MFDGGNVRIYRETANGITLVRSSTVINFFADTLVANHKRITFAAGPAVQAGDIYVISRESTSDLNEFCHPRLTWIREGANTWEKKCDDQFGVGNVANCTKSLSTDVPPNGGTTSCKIVNTNANNLENGIAQYFNNSAESGEFAMDSTKTYRFTVWLKQTGIANGKVPTILPICESNGIAPYLICSPSFSEQDFLDMMEYLAGPATTVFGAKRAAQGHAAPYSATIPKFYIEIGNETWNDLFAPWTYDFNGERYGKFAQYFFNIIKTSPYYNAAQFEFVVGVFLYNPTSLATDKRQ